MSNKAILLLAVVGVGAVMYLRRKSTRSNSANLPTFTVKNAVGQDVTSDGKPVYSMYDQYTLGSMPSYLDQLFPEGSGFSWLESIDKP